MAVDRTADIEEINADLDRLNTAYDEIKKVSSANYDITNALSSLKDYYLSSVNIPQDDFGSKMTGLNEDAAGAISNISNNILKAHQAAIRILNDLLKEQEEYEREQKEQG